MAAHKWRPEVAVLLQIKWRRLYRSICPSVHLLASHFGHFCGAIEQFGLYFAKVVAGCALAATLSGRQP